MADRFSIGIVTYVKRFRSYFIPLIQDIANFFPDIEVVCIANGHPDKNLQYRYLREYTEFLSQYPNVRSYTFDEHQSLAKLWNLALIYCTGDGCLILNDDVRIGPKFRKSLEDFLVEHHGFFMVNNSFSHFFVSKPVIKKIGWFDERFPGLGHEDGDFLIRLSLAGIKLENLKSSDMFNFVAPAEDPTWSEISKNANTKYTRANEEFFIRKWDSSWHQPEIKDWDVEFTWKNEIVRAKLKDRMETPLFHEFSLLDSPPASPANLLASARIKTSAGLRLFPLWLKEKAKSLFRKT